MCNALNPQNKKLIKSTARNWKKGTDLQPTLKLSEASAVPEEWKEIITSAIDAFKAISISNSMVHLPITALMKALSLTMENTAQNNLLEEIPLGLCLNYGASTHLKDIFFMKKHTVE